MVKLRNCAWQRKDSTRQRTIWARAGVVSSCCPKSVITAQSQYFLEQFRYWKELGGGTPWTLEAKSADAIAILDQAYQMENHSVSE
jgi:hypothetical protein